MKNKGELSLLKKCFFYTQLQAICVLNNRSNENSTYFSNKIKMVFKISKNNG